MEKMKLCRVFQVFPLNRERNLGAYPGQNVEISEERFIELSRTGHVGEIPGEEVDPGSVLNEKDFQSEVSLEEEVSEGEESSELEEETSEGEEVKRGRGRPRRR